MINFINRLNEKQQYKLLQLLGFKVIRGKFGFRKGTISYENGDELIFHSFDHNYYMQIDFYDDYIYISDFTVKDEDGQRNKNKSKILRKYLFAILGEKYKAEFAKFIDKEKERSLKLVTASIQEKLNEKYDQEVEELESLSDE